MTARPRAVIMCIAARRAAARALVTRVRAAGRTRALVVLWTVLERALGLQKVVGVVARVAHGLVAAGRELAGARGAARPRTRDLSTERHVFTREKAR